MSKFFRLRESQASERTKVRDEQDLQDQIVSNFSLQKMVPVLGIFRAKFHCFDRAEKSKRNLGYLNKASNRITKELDLQKFLHRQRVTLTAAISLLKGR